MVKVACAIVYQKGLYFVCQRAPHKSQALQWEFPGGKIEAGETAEAALHRELQEELAWQVCIERALTPIHWYYPKPQNLHLELHAFLCSCNTEARPVLKEHVAQAWLTLRELQQLDLCAADRPLLEQLAALEASFQ